MLPRRYWAWLGGTAVSLLGTQVLAFAMAWEAAGQGGRLAGLVFTAIALPRVLLLLFGGAVADRVGAWRVMITGDATMILVTVTLAAGAWRLADPPALLLVTALAIGIVDAFYLPSSGSMPRRLVPGAGLARAMSARQQAGHLATFAGPSLGGLVLGVAGLAAAALASAGTYLVLLVILIALRPRDEQLVAPAVQQPTWRAALDGLRLAWSDAALRPALLLTMAAAAFLLPVSSLLVPLVARERGWPPQVAGAVAGTIALGTAAVAVAVLARGARPRPGVAAIAGLLAAAMGICVLALAQVPLWAVSAGMLVGVGTGSSPRTSVR